jgi:hypothetical protein
LIVEPTRRYNPLVVRKQILKTAPVVKPSRLDLENLASFEISSEDPNHPIENALREDQQSWRAMEDGEQSIRLTFDSPQSISRIVLCFEENRDARTQEFVLRSRSPEEDWREIVRQQFNFSPPQTTIEREIFTVSLKDVLNIELRIVPNISGNGRASLRELLIDP